MPRINRSEYLADDTLYHVRLQLNNSEMLFSSDEIYNLWESVTAIYLKKCPSIKLAGFEWMNTHAHLIVHAGRGEDLPKFIHDVCWRFALMFNKKFNRKGHLFQNRYQASVINTDEYALGCQRYVYRNQLSALMVDKLDDTRWSSYHHYAYGKKHPLITNIYTYGQFGPTDEVRQLEFRLFVEKMTETEETLWRARLKHPRLKTKKEIVKNYLKTHHIG